MPSVVDLWAGAGGLSLGLEKSGWTLVTAVDPDCDAVETLRRNQARGHFRTARILRADIRNVSARDLLPAKRAPRWRLDLLVGGPPCQPFSVAGRRQGLKDPRGRQFHELVRLADEMKPRFILFENIAGLITARTSDGRVGGVLVRIQREFEGVGYACRFGLLNAADYGAPQRRVGLFMMASRNERLPQFPLPTHSCNESPTLTRWMTLGDFWATYPHPKSQHIVRPNVRRAAALNRLAPAYRSAYPRYCRSESAWRPLGLPTGPLRRRHECAEQEHSRCVYAGLGSVVRRLASFDLARVCGASRFSF